MFAVSDRCPQCGGPAPGANILCLSCAGADARPRFQPVVGWLLLLSGAAGLSYGGWRLLTALAGQRSASPADVATSASAGVLWAVVLFFLLPGVVFAYAGVSLLKGHSVDPDS